MKDSSIAADGQNSRNKKKEDKMREMSVEKRQDNRAKYWRY